VTRFRWPFSPFRAPAPYPEGELIDRKTYGSLGDPARRQNAMIENAATVYYC
jgi:hypothetical protein